MNKEKEKTESLKFDKLWNNKEIEDGKNGWPWKKNDDNDDVKKDAAKQPFNGNMDWFNCQWNSKMKYNRGFKKK